MGASPWQRITTLLLGLSLLAVPAGFRPAAAEQQPIKLRVVGGLAGVSQYERLEEPFWTRQVPVLTHGRITAEIYPNDRSGLPGPEMLQLMRLGVVPFGTALLAVVAGEEPELNAVDLPTLSPDMATLRQNVSLYREHLQTLLRNRYGIELLAIYAYPAQVLYCTKPFNGLQDLAGRRVRTSSVGQSELMTATGAVPVLIPFADIVSSIRSGVVDCAITGTLSGNEIGLNEVTSYVHAMALSWGLSFFGANRTAWEAIPADLRDVLRQGVERLEQDVWDASARETAAGLACDAGYTLCGNRPRGHMTVVPVTPTDDAYRRRLLVESVVPSWVQRCGPECADAWNENFAPTLGFRAKAD